MPRARKVFWLGFVLLIFVVAFGSVFRFRQAIFRKSLEYALNQNSKDFFVDTIRIQEARLDRHLRIHIQGLKAYLVAENGLVSLQAASIESENSILNFFSEEGLRLRFEGLRPSMSEQAGIRGVCRIRGGPQGLFQLKASIEALDFEYLVWLNPEFLMGSSGVIQGEIFLEAQTGKEPQFQSYLQVKEPGGRVQSRFFKLFTPYLPNTPLRKELKQIASVEELVQYKEGVLQIGIAESDKIKVFLHTVVPEYNLDLNVQIDIRLDEKHALMQLAQLIGLMKLQIHE
jgi:hypothetical protein